MVCGWYPLGSASAIFAPSACGSRTYSSKVQQRTLTTADHGERPRTGLPGAIAIRAGAPLASILHGCDVLAWWAGRPAFLILVSGVRRGVPARLSRRVGAGSTAGCGSLLSGWLGWGGRVMAGAGP